MEKLKVSNGKIWFRDYQFKGNISIIKLSHGIDGIKTNSPYDVTYEQAEGNSRVLIDGIYTYQQCSLLPSELLEQRDRLLQTLKQIERGVTGLPLQVLQIIDSIEKQENETK